MFFSNLWQRMLLAFPGRVRLGKLGMWMVRVGELLQRKYAGWNNKFRLKCEVFGNQQCAYIHVSEPLTNREEISFSNPEAQRNLRPLYVDEIFKIKGIRSVYLQRYQLQIKWGAVFNSNEIIPQVERILIEHLPNAATI